MRVGLLAVTPLRFYTVLVRWIAAIPLPRPLRGVTFGPLARCLGVDMAEAEHDVREYRSFADLFVRRLKHGQRPVEEAEDAIVSPVDACVAVKGTADGQRLFQAKGIDYSLAQLVGDDQLARELEGGEFVTLYLRPKDYHRIHCPVDGAVVASRYIPGALFPVQPWAVRCVKGLFVRNERMVVEIDSTVGKVAFVWVGATAVGAITSVFGADKSSHKTFDPPVQMRRGDEMGAFNLGSTVIAIFQRGRVALRSFDEGDEVRVGQLLGRRRLSSLRVA